ncbi:MAG TPA: proton-conducting transporter membrane subunit, partial [Halanaerobiales bacterium]|nr:proton-conducting transporter membrane subunit [Halanaerobiales bacterium]
MMAIYEYLSSNFYIGQTGVIFAITGFLLSFLTIIIARSEIKGNKRKYYYLINLVFILSFLAIIFTSNWLLFFIAWELVTLTTALLLLWKGRGVAGQYFIIQFAGSSLLMIVILLAISNGYSEISLIEESWLQNLFVLGFGTKSALFGFHFWIPAIYIQAPVFFTAISSGWVAKLGFITMLRLLPEGNNLLLILGLLMVFYGGIKALLASNYRVLLGYSSVSQLGYVAIGLGSGFIYGYLGAVLHIVAHGLVKTGLFIGSNSLNR